MKTFRPYQLKALEALKQHNKGIISIPTGGGKSLIFLQNVKEALMYASSPINVVIVAPKILLATQLESQFKSFLNSFQNVFMTNVHSGENGTTDVEMLKASSKLIHQMNCHHLMFTTYKSLQRINEAGLKIDLAIFDEAHHSTTESNFIGVAQTSSTASQSFFFTATPKHTDNNRSMSNTDVYGGIISSVSAKELVSNGYILPPKILTYELDVERTKENSHEVDAHSILTFVDTVEIEYPKILVSVPSTQIMMDMFSDTELLKELENRQYHIFSITSKYGAIYNGEKISREKFFEILTHEGNNPQSKIIVYHVSIISEGVDIPSLNCALLLRNLPYIELIQTIGRIIRKHHTKEFGTIAVPISGTYGKAIAVKLQEVVNRLFVEGKILIV